VLHADSANAVTNAGADDRTECPANSARLPGAATHGIADTSANALNTSISYAVTVTDPTFCIRSLIASTWGTPAASPVGGGEPRSASAG